MNQRFSLVIDQLFIDDAAIVGIIGPNGSGKTTLLKLLVGLLNPDRGRICLFNEDIGKGEYWKMRTGAYLDENFLVDFLYPEEYFDFIANMGNRETPIMHDHLKVFDVFFNGQIWKQDKYIRDLSTGNKSKIGIAAALMTGSGLVVLDEPFAHIDMKSAMVLKNLIKDQSQKRNTGFIVSAHDLNLLTALCDRIIVLEHGRVQSDYIIGAYRIDEFRN